MTLRNKFVGMISQELHKETKMVSSGTVTPAKAGVQKNKVMWIPSFGAFEKVEIASSSGTFSK